MATQKLYIAKLETGEEIGPVEQEALVKLAENGTITATTMVRSKLIPEWNKAGSVDFLKAIIFRQQQENLKQQALNKSAWQRLVERVTLTAPQAVVNSAGGLVQTRPEALPKASPLSRILAGLTDAIILALCLAGIFYGGAQLLAQGVLDDSNAVPLTLCAMLAFYLLYFTLQIGLGSNQTIGQRIWGVQLIRQDGKPFWMARAYFFALLLLPLGVFSPIFMLLNLRSYPEVLTRTRLAKVLAKKGH